MKKLSLYLFLLTVVLVNAFMVYSLKHDRLPFLNTKSVEAMAWEEMINPYWEGMRLIHTVCECDGNGGEGVTLQCSYFADMSNESCGDGQHGLDRCYEKNHLGITPLCDTFSWLDADLETWYHHP